MARIYCVMWAASLLEVGGLGRLQRSALLGSHLSRGRGSHWGPGGAREKVWAVWGTPGPRQEGCVAQGAGQGQRQSVYTRLCVFLHVCWGCAGLSYVCVSSLHSLAWAQVWGLIGGPL